MSDAPVGFVTDRYEDSFSFSECFDGELLVLGATTLMDLPEGMCPGLGDDIIGGITLIEGCADEKAESKLKMAKKSGKPSVPTILF